ncbi:MAG: GYD domain-containing protein, partial [Rickettsiales bacterium]
PMGVHVLYLVKYHNDQKAAMLARPEMRDRAEVHKKAIADFGGKPIAQYGSYGEWDMVYIYEMPDQTSIAANLHLTDSFGLAMESKAIPLLTMEDFVESLKRAAETETSYSPATD